MYKLSIENGTHCWDGNNVVVVVVVVVADVAAAEHPTYACS